jgi:tyrosyl-tRNA synthetase
MIAVFRYDLQNYASNKFKLIIPNLKIGGSDQMGNIMSGHDLIGKAASKKVYGR